jgi:hypothetical protein
MAAAKILACRGSMRKVVDAPGDQPGDWKDDDEIPPAELIAGLPNPRG